MPLSESERLPLTRRKLMTMIGSVAGGAVMYQAMHSLGMAAESGYKGPPKLSGAKKGATVLVLGAGVAGMVAAYELRKAGYKVRVLEFSERPGGRCWSVRDGDVVREMDGSVQRCAFAPGEYFNPGPWRIPHHHHGLLSYCRTLGVPLEPFVQVNYNAYVHSSKAFGGKPQRYRHVQADFQGHVAELLSKATSKGELDGTVTKEDGERLLGALRHWGALDSSYRYVANDASSNRRGYDVEPGGGLMPKARPSKPLASGDLLRSELWKFIAAGQGHKFQSTLFQPVGGMDTIAKAFAKEVGSLIQYRTKVTKIEQNERGVTVTYEDGAKGGATAQAKADWCICTIPLSILSQIDLQAGPELLAAIRSVPYGSSVKIGLQFNRRFWEEDEGIYGGITYTDLPIYRIAYPPSGFNKPGKSVLLGAYIFDGPNSFEFGAMTPAERVRAAVKFGAQIHPQYEKEFDSGVAVAWYRRAGQQGCFGLWSDDLRQKHYRNLCEVDNRLVLAGEHCSYLPAWIEGAVLSATDAVQRLHARAIV